MPNVECARVYSVLRTYVFYIHNYPNSPPQQQWSADSFALVTCFLISVFRCPRLSFLVSLFLLLSPSCQTLTSHIRSKTCSTRSLAQSHNPRHMLTTNHKQRAAILAHIHYYPPLLAMPYSASSPRRLATSAQVHPKFLPYMHAPKPFLRGPAVRR